MRTLCAQTCHVIDKMMLKKCGVKMYDNGTVRVMLLVCLNIRKAGELFSSVL